MYASNTRSNISKSGGHLKYNMVRVKKRSQAFITLFVFQKVFCRRTDQEETLLLYLNMRSSHRKTIRGSSVRSFSVYCVMYGPLLAKAFTVLTRNLSEQLEIELFAFFCSFKREFQKTI